MLAGSVVVMAFFMMLISRVCSSFMADVPTSYNSYSQCLWFRQAQEQSCKSQQFNFLAGTLQVCAPKTEQILKGGSVKKMAYVGYWSNCG